MEKTTKGRRAQIDIAKNPHQYAGYQLLQSYDNKYCLLYGPSGSAKSFTTLLVIYLRAMAAPGSRHMVFRDTRQNCEQTLFDKTLHEVLDKVFPGAKQQKGFSISLSDLSVTLPNGSMIFFNGLDENRGDKVLGDEFATIWFNECNAFAYKQVSQLFSRLRQNITMVDGDKLKNKMFFDCNPRWFTDWDYRAFIEKVNPATGDSWEQPDEWQALFMDTIHNQSNLSDDYIPSLKLGTPEDVQRYFTGYWSNSSANSLFTPDKINDARIAKPKKSGRDMTARETLDHLKALGISIKQVGVFGDPAVTANKNSDETGICVAAVDDEDHAYILADYSTKDVPDVVCQIIVDAYHEWGASMIVMEKNQGGLWLDAALRKIWKAAPLSFVDANRTTGGKQSRAEPVSAQYSRGVVHHVGSFQKLEEQMTQFGNKGASKSPDRMDAMVWAVTIQGSLLSSWVEGMSSGRITRIEQQIRLGMVASETTDQIVSRIRGTKALQYRDGIMDVSRRSAQSMVRTAVSHVSNVASQETWKANAHIVKGWQFLATLDGRTTVTCAGLSGQFFPIGEGPIPPRHIRCRSVSVPVTKSFKELGVDADELSKGTRASMDGQVAADTTFADFLKRKGDSFQDQVLGKTRADLWRNGKLDLADFIKSDGTVLTLEQLRKSYPGLLDK